MKFNNGRQKNSFQPNCLFPPLAKERFTPGNGENAFLDSLRDRKVNRKEGGDRLNKSENNHGETGEP